MVFSILFLIWSRVDLQYDICFRYTTTRSWEFPGSPIVRALCSHCRRHPFDPSLGNKSPTNQALWPRTNNSNILFSTLQKPLHISDFDFLIYFKGLSLVQHTDQKNFLILCSKQNMSNHRTIGEFLCFNFKVEEKNVREAVLVFSFKRDFFNNLS